jgi:hypothetical protein
MLRAATFGDLPRLYEIVEEMHVRSGYAKRGIELSPPWFDRASTRASGGAATTRAIAGST